MTRIADSLFAYSVDELLADRRSDLRKIGDDLRAVLGDIEDAIGEAK